ncbi:MAG TPA: hypothetical protein VFO07_16445 [Roseiflexaceae bacterium]|nr:hypothetical protein [Roseiflexaceae bacterium]
MNQAQSRARAARDAEGNGQRLFAKRRAAIGTRIVRYMAARFRA